MLITLLQVVKCWHKKNTSDGMIKPVSICTGHFVESLDITLPTSGTIMYQRKFRMRLVNRRFYGIIEHRRPDIILHDAEKGECLIIDVAIPADKNIADKEVEKITKYAELKVEISRMWGYSAAKVEVIPIVIGALGSIPKKLTHFLEQLDIRTDMRVLQKSALLGTAHILRKVLSV